MCVTETLSYPKKFSYFEWLKWFTFKSWQFKGNKGIVLEQHLVCVAIYSYFYEWLLKGEYDSEVKSKFWFLRKATN